MIVLPAIDIKDGKCVRLTQGEFDRQNTYYENPADVAELWSKLGVSFLHVVDLDGALQGKRKNAEAIFAIAQVTSFELGGGIRTLEDIEHALELGASRIIIGTAAIQNPGFVADAVARYGDKVMVSIDAKNGLVATDGWTKTLDKKATEFAREMEEMGVATLIYTDIAKDGMLQGPNFDELIALNNAVSCNVIASGGVSSMEDIRKLEKCDFYGCIIGKALYEGNIHVEELV